jgi:trimeric autotransporter adhesin
LLTLVLMDALLRMAAAVCGRAASAGRLRRARQRGRQVLAVLTGLVVAAGTSLAAVAVPAVVAGAVVAGVTASAVATAVPARATGGLPVLVVLVNGESTAPEAALLTAAGYTVTSATVATLESMSQSAFQGYAAVVMGDPSTGGTCSSWQPTTGTLGTNWEGWVTGNVAVLGTAPELAAGLASSGNTAAKTLITGTAEYAAAQPSATATTVTQTGLYLSLDCADKTAATGTAVSVLNSVEGIGTVGEVTVNGTLACTDSGTVNTWEASAAGTLGGFTSAALAAGSPGWVSPGCPVQEAFDSWPAMFTPVAYDTAADATVNFTASDGATGQPYILLGAPVSAATQALAPSTSGEVPAGTTAGGSGNPAAAGVSQALAAGSVNTENGNLTQSATDLSVPTYGPALSFSRTYDAGAAQQQTQTGTPGAMGYGWTDSWASSLTSARPVAGDIYTLDGMRSANGGGGPASSAAMGDPSGVVYNGGNEYIADTSGNRVLEVAGSTGTQWGVSMTAGDIYVVAGKGIDGQYSVLSHPQGIAFDSAGDMYIADTWDNRVEEIPLTTKTQWGVSMTADVMITVAGSATGASGSSGDGGQASSAYLYSPAGLAFDSAGDLYIGDSANNRVQEVVAASGTQWGLSRTASDVYTIAGGTSGSSGDGGAASGAALNGPTGITVDSAGDVIFADSGNNRVQEIDKVAGTATQWGQSMTANDIYTIAGSATGTAGTSGDGGAVASALLDGPQSVAWASPNLYIADALNNRVQEMAGAGGTFWGQSMTVGDMYTIAGSTAGFSGDGGAAASATLDDPLSLTLDGSGNLYVADADNNRVREVTASTHVISTYAGDGLTVATAGDGGPATQAALNNPMQEAFDSHGDTYIADAGNNRVQEIASYSHTQYGIAMTAGDVYTIAGQANGQVGCKCDGLIATSGYLDNPWGITIDNSGDLYIADSGNNRIQEVPASGGTFWGQSMTAGYMYTIAGYQYATPGYTGDGGPASAALLDNPIALTMDAAGNIYIADSWNNRVQEIAAVTGTKWGQSMTAGDIYTIAGSATGAHGSTGDAGPAASALLYGDGGLALSPSGDLFIGDDGNNRVQELAAATHAQWGQSMTANDIYTVTSAPGGGQAGDGGPASAARIDGAPSLAADASGDLYIADQPNNRIQEIANVTGTQWGQSMTAGDEYTVAGSATGTSGNSGDGGPAASALLANTESISLDPENDLYITDNANDTVREVASATANAIAPAPGQTSALVIAPAGTAPGGLTVTQPGGAQVTFWAQTAGACATGYVVTGSYCILPQDQGATLAYNSGTQVYTFSSAPGSLSYTYSLSGASGPLTSETDTAGNTLTITASSPAPGGTVTGNGTCPATAVSCQTITSASGRALILGYSAAADAGHVTSATDPMNRTWTYGYTGSDLTSVTDPMSNKTTYTYGIGTGNTSPLLANDLLSITAPNAQTGGPDAGDATTNVYNNNGQVTSQTSPAGWTTSFGYCVNATAGNCMNSATGTGLVTVTDPDSNQTVYDYDQGTLAAQSSWTKTITSLTLTAENDSVPDTTAATTANPSGGTLLDTSSTNGDGNTTTSSYDTDGNLTSSTGPGANGTPATATTAYTASLQQADCAGAADAASTATCGQDPGPATVAPGGVITPPSSTPPLGLTYTLYDTDGNELYTTTGVYEPGATTAAYSQTTYQLFKNNSVTLSGTTINCTATPPSQTLPCAKISADGVVTQLSYNSMGDLTSSSTPDGNGTEIAKTTYTDNGDGEQLTTVAPDGNVSGANAGNYTTTTAWNADDKQTSVTKGNGSGYTDTPRTTSYTYDGDENQIQVEDARAYTTITTYNADDKATVVTNPDSNAILTCYDGDGNVAQTVPAVGVAANSLTAASCPTAYPSGYGTRLATDALVSTFNAQGLKIQQTSPAPVGQSGYETTTYTYDGDGNQITSTAPAVSSGGASVVTVDTYDASGQLASETTGYGTSAASTVSYCYDPQGNQTSAVSADGNTSGTAACSTSYPWTVTATPQANYQTTYKHDSANELVTTITPANTASSTPTTTATYDPAGNMLTSTDPNGVTFTDTYTPVNLKASVSYSGSSAHAVSYTYDADGQKTAMTDATGTPSYTYDPFGEITSTTNGDGQTVGYGYDSDGDTTGTTYPLPVSATWATTDTVSYGYDHADRLTSVSDFTGNTINITPNADGAVTKETLGSSGDTITTAYGNSQEVSSITLANSSMTTLQSYTYSDAPNGSILSETDTPSSANSPAVYTYDAQSRATSDTPGTGSAKNYSFDASSNLTTLPTEATGSYNDAAQLTSSALSGTTTNYTYNADGERLGSVQGSTTESAATWNGAMELATYDNSAANMTAATYDGDGLRASSTIASGGVQHYAWDVASPDGRLLTDSSNAYIYDGYGIPLEQVSLSSGTVTYLISDAQGSVRGVVASGGLLTGSTSYDAWGNPSTSLAADTPYGFAGGYTDTTGLVYLIHRYYDPQTGQFLSVDPLVSSTHEPYDYTDGDPVNEVDPAGTFYTGTASYSWNSGSTTITVCYSGGVACVPISVSTGGGAITGWWSQFNYSKKEVGVWWWDAKFCTQGTWECGDGTKLPAPQFEMEVKYNGSDSGGPSRSSLGLGYYDNWQPAGVDLLYTRYVNATTGEAAIEFYLWIEEDQGRRGVFHSAWRGLFRH